MRTTPIEKIISIEDLRRNFGAIKKTLPYANFIITDRGKQIGVLAGTRESKRARMKSTAGAFRRSGLDRDGLWQEVVKKRSRKTDISL